jgi:hypothetical protein
MMHNHCLVFNILSLNNQLGKMKQNKSSTGQKSFRIEFEILKFVKKNR